MKCKAISIAFLLSFLVLLVTFCTLFFSDSTDTALLRPYHQQNVLKIRHRYNERHQNDPNLSMESKDPDPIDYLTVVTGISSNHYSESLDMIGTVHYYLPNSNLLIYDLGLRQHQVKVLQKLRNTYVIPYNFSRYPQYDNNVPIFMGCYTWKVHILYEIKREHQELHNKQDSRSNQLFLWLDASARIIKPIDCCIKTLKSFPLVSNEKHMPEHNIVAFAKDSTLKYLNITRESMRGVPGLPSGVLLFNKSSPIAQFLLEKWVDCALHRECICGDGLPPYLCQWIGGMPKGRVEYNGCHRYDQTALSLLVAKYFGKSQEVTSEDCSSTFHIERKPTMNWRRYITLKEH